jgi:isopentenyl-diphosphate delta-isomerase
MVNKDELLCVVDEHDTPIEPVSRHQAFKKGLWRRTVQVWIVNDKKQILCQKRSSKKDMGAGLWEATVGGHLSPGDNYFTGAVREVREETGLPIETHHLELLKIYKDHKFREYRGIFYCKWNTDVNELVIEEDEVEEVKLVALPTLKKHLKNPQSWVIPGYEKEMFSTLHSQI